MKAVQLFLSMVLGGFGLTGARAEPVPTIAVLPLTSEPTLAAFSDLLSASLSQASDKYVLVERAEVKKLSAEAGIQKLNATQRPMALAKLAGDGCACLAQHHVTVFDLRQQQGRAQLRASQVTEGEPDQILDTDKTVEANFVTTAALTVFTRGGGRVEQSAEDGIYLFGDSAVVHAEPLPGWVFAGWSGAVSGTGADATVVMSANKIVTATFRLSFEAWTAREFDAVPPADPAVSGSGADPEGDGVENWREWLRGSDPQDAASRGQGGLRREGRWVCLSYTRMRECA